MDLSFAQLIAAVRAGDESAIERLFTAFEADVRRMVRSRLPQSLRSRFDSLDFAQDVWQSVLIGTRSPLAAGSFADPAHFRGLLAGIVRNKVLQEYRRRTRTRKYDLSREEPLYVRRGGKELPRPVTANDPTPSQELQAQDCWERIVAGRTSMEKEIADRKRRGLTNQQIAASMGIHERTVRRVLRGMQASLESESWR